MGDSHFNLQCERRVIGFVGNPENRPLVRVAQRQSDDLTSDRP